MVKLSTVAKFVGLSLAIATVNAAPASPNLSHLQFKRDGHGKGKEDNDDVGILNFALTLEHLEAEFYREGLEKFGVEDFKHISKHDPEGALRAFQFIGKSEAVHVTTLETVIKSLGGEPVPPCEYNFGISDIQTFAAIARALEQTGVSAYTGALAKIQASALQTAGGTIGTVEARHSTFLNGVLNGEPIPYPFDTPLEAREVVTIAAPFIKKCPYEIPFHTNPTLKVTNGDGLRPNSTVRVESSAFTDQDKEHGLSCAFVYNNKFVVRTLSKCDIPATVRGYTYLMIIEGDQKLDETNQDKIRAGPALIFIDDLGFDRKNGGNNRNKKGDHEEKKEDHHEEKKEDRHDEKKDEDHEEKKEEDHEEKKEEDHEEKKDEDHDSSMKHRSSGDSEDSNEREDSIEGEDSEDPIEGEDSEDPIEGEDSEDPIEGEDSEDPIEGEDSEDPIEGEGSEDPIEGEDSEDPIEGEEEESVE